MTTMSLANLELVVTHTLKGSVDSSTVMLGTIEKIDSGRDIVCIYASQLTPLVLLHSMFVNEVEIIPAYLHKF